MESQEVSFRHPLCDNDIDSDRESDSGSDFSYTSDFETEDELLDLDSESDTTTNQRQDTDIDGRMVEEEVRLNRGVPDVGMSHFSFAWSNGDDFRPDQHAFRHEGRGLKEDFPCDDQARESDYFRVFLDDEILNLIADESNKYFHFKYPERASFWPFSKTRKWEATTLEELIVFFALILLMPLCKKLNRQDYWKNDNLSIPLFKKYMTRDRFFMLSKFLHFADNNDPNEDDPIWKVRQVFTMFVTRFSKYFDPYRKMVIDESLVLYKGRLSFKQYIPTKRHRFGIKLFVLCDCDTGVIVDVIVYTGKDVDIPKVKKSNPLGMSGAIVMKMMAPYIGEGRLLFLDNWYTSPALCQILHENRTDSCGTVKANRKFMPKFNGPKKDVDKDYGHAQVSNGKSSRFIQREKSGKILALNWGDKREVHFLSTVHTGEMVRAWKIDHHTKKPIWKPDVVVDYTNNMRLVDKSDSQIGSVECIRRTVKWYRKLFYHLLDMAMLNAYNFWLIRHEYHYYKRLKLRDFIYNVCMQLLQDYGQQRHLTVGRPPTDIPDRLKANTHFIVSTDVMPNGKKRLLHCKVCAHTTRGLRKRTRVTHMCEQCEVALCVTPCYKIYHTIDNF